MTGAQPKGKSKATLTARGEKSQPPPGREYLAPATCRAPPPARRLRSQPGMQPGGWNRTEGASTPPLFPRFPNDRGGKFTSRDGVAFCWVSLTPLRRLPSLGSPSFPAQPSRRLPLHLETNKPGLGHLRRRVPLGICPLPPGRPGVARGCRRPTHLWWGSVLPCALLGRPAPGSEVHSGSSRRHASRTLLHSACVGEQARQRAARAWTSVCLCVCARASMCVSVRACVGRG